MPAPKHVLDEMGAYETCLADARRLYRRAMNAPPSERAAAKRDYERALSRARELGARLTRDLNDAARGHAA